MTVLFYYETAGARDTVSLIRPIEEFYNSHFEEPEFSTLAITCHQQIRGCFCKQCTPLAVRLCNLHNFPVKICAFTQTS